MFWMLAETVPAWDGPASLAWLSEAETRRLGTLRFPKRRNEWLAGRLAAKKLLFSSLPSLSGSRPSDVSIENEPEGAPRVYVLGQPCTSSLSISHRDQLAFCAVSEGSALTIGADIERIESRAEAFIADYFTGGEQSLLEGIPINVRDRLATLIWSAKEAALKALRKGLRLDTRTVEIISITEGAKSWGDFSVRSGQAAGGDWRGLWQIRGGYVLTLALLGRPEAVMNARVVQAEAGSLDDTGGRYLPSFGKALSSGQMNGVTGR